MTRTGLRPGGFGAIDNGFGFVDDRFSVVDGELFVVFWTGVLFDEVMGWRFDDFSRLIFSCWFGFDEFFMFWVSWV